MPTYKISRGNIDISDHETLLDALNEAIYRITLIYQDSPNFFIFSRDQNRIQVSQNDGYMLGDYIITKYEDNERVLFTGQEIQAVNDYYDIIRHRTPKRELGTCYYIVYRDNRVVFCTPDISMALDWTVQQIESCWGLDTCWHIQDWIDYVQVIDDAAQSYYIRKYHCGKMVSMLSDNRDSIREFWGVNM